MQETMSQDESSKNFKFSFKKSQNKTWKLKLRVHEKLQFLLRQKIIIPVKLINDGWFLNWWEKCLKGQQQFYTHEGERKLIKFYYSALVRRVLLLSFWRSVHLAKYGFRPISSNEPSSKPQEKYVVFKLSTQWDHFCNNDGEVFSPQTFSFDIYSFLHNCNNKFSK